MQKLGVDWRLLLAQVVNFIILFLILRRFLYRPVLAMLAERRDRIAKGLTDAEVSAQRLRNVEHERNAVLHRAEEERRSVMVAAVGEAEVLRAERLTQAEREAAAVIARGQREADRLRQETLDAVRRDAAALIGTIARKVTADRMTPAAHEQLIADATAELAKAKLK